MVKLSVNVNKVATLRNSREGREPNLLEAVAVCIEAGAPGITVHPREDQRHIRPQDVLDISTYIREHAPEVEFNIEGDAREDLLKLVQQVKPTQCTLVPVLENEVTSQGSWPASTDEVLLKKQIAELRASGVRVSVFVSAEQPAVRWAHSLGADRIELYTEPYADAHNEGKAAVEASFDTFQAASILAHELGMGVNAGHDLNLDNLPLFSKLAHLDEVSIGHALVCKALYEGLAPVVKKYLSVLN